MDIVKFGIVGCGEAWLFHRSGYNKNSKRKFVSVYDVDQKRAKNAARMFKMNVFSTYEEFLKSDIDAVLLMVPHYLHEKLVVAAAEAGKHVLCEKPMATTLEGCDEMIKATKKAGVKFMIAENHRFLPAHKYIAEAVHNGLIGNVFLIRSYEGVNEISGLMKPGFWKGDPLKAGGGSLADMGAHKFAVMNWILNDEVENAYAWLTKQRTNLAEKAEDNAMAFLKFKSGAIAETVLSFTVCTPPTNSLEVCGTLGTILEDHSWQYPVKIYSTHEDMGQHKNKWYEPEIEHAPFPKYYEISFRIEDDYFTSCILEDKDPEFTPEQARAAISTVLMAYLSARLERTATEKELMDIYKKKGTKSILEGLEKFVQNNY